MYQTITRGDFVDAFKVRQDNFSYQGLQALFDYLEEYEESTGESLELDVIALCCDFTEYADFEEFQADYGDEYETLDDVSEQTDVIEVPGRGFIIRAF